MKIPIILAFLICVSHTYSQNLAIFKYDGNKIKYYRESQSESSMPKVENNKIFLNYPNFSKFTTNNGKTWTKVIPKNQIIIFNYPNNRSKISYDAGINWEPLYKKIELKSNTEIKPEDSKYESVVVYDLFGRVVDTFRSISEYGIIANLKSNSQLGVYFITYKINDIIFSKKFNIN